MLLIFSLVPILGYVFDLFLKRKTIIYILLFAGLLTLPLLFGYEYFIQLIILIPQLLLAGSIYSLLISSIEKRSLKIALSISLAIVLFFILGFASFLNEMGGSQTTKRKWELDEYRIEYIVDQGFAGHALLKYEIRKYGVIPIFLKKVETLRDTCTQSCCVINFPEERISFNTCTGELKKLSK